MQIKRSSVGSTVVCLGLIIASQGCGDNKPVVEGKVLHKGHPLVNGEVRFFGPKDQTITALIGPDGSYSANGCALGETKVAVVSFNTNSQPVAEPGRKNGAVFKGNVANPISLIPERYGNPESSGISVSIRAGKQKIEITLDD